MDQGNFTLEALICPAGYVLRPHTTQTGVSVCTCNENIADILLCEEDQETVVIKVSVEREGDGSSILRQSFQAPDAL